MGFLVRSNHRLRLNGAPAPFLWCGVALEATAYRYGYYAPTFMSARLVSRCSRQCRLGHGNVIPYKVEFKPVVPR
jgi:hypothetical protein